MAKEGHALEAYLLLTTAQVAAFVAHGFLELPAVVPPLQNDAAADELERARHRWGRADRPFAATSGQSLSTIYPEPSALGRVLRLPAVAGAIHSLVGPEARFDHDFIHHRQARDPTAQHLHQDAMVDVGIAFDIQLLYFPSEVKPGGGGTAFVPGTHLRRVHETDVGRYAHMRGERQWEGPAGSILVFHQGMWHRGMPNASDESRTMYKIRLNPTVPQVRRWDLTDLEAMHNGPEDHIFATFRTDSVAAALRVRHPWMGEADYRLELANRATLWRYLTGDVAFDVDWYLTRTEHRATLG